MKHGKHIEPGTDPVRSKRPVNLADCHASPGGPGSFLYSITMSTELPFFKWFPKDYLSDENVAMMTLREEGAYRRLLDYCWLQGSLDSDLSRLARLCRVGEDDMADIWSSISGCFREDENGRIIHPRLEKEREKALNRKQKLSEAGKRGRRKQLQGNDPEATPGPPPGQARATERATPGHSQKADTEIDTDTEETPSGSDEPSVDRPEHWMHEIWHEELGIEGHPINLTEKRKNKYRAMYGEHLDAAKRPQDAWRAVLRCVQESDHHMSVRRYQFPESILRNPERREQWVQDTIEAMQNGGGGKANNRLHRNARSMAEHLRRRQEAHDGP